MSEIRVTTGNADSRELLIKLLTLESQWDTFVDVANAMHVLDEIVLEVVDKLPEGKSTQERLDFALDYLYMQCGFSTTVQEIPESQLQSVAFAVFFRTGESVNLGVVISYLLTKLFFNVSLVTILGEVFISVNLPESEEAILVDPTTGTFEYKVLADSRVLPSPNAIFPSPLDNLRVFTLYLNRQKSAFIHESMFEQALCCVDQLMKYLPKDPYQYRDRGFLLHYLDCDALARSDFEKFIQQCPDDPAAQMLKMQLDEKELEVRTVH